ncbi:MAG: hypothetical protein V3V01_04565 [Acidimicrobiales bacterium]
MSAPDQHTTADDSLEPARMSWSEATVRAQAIHEGIDLAEPAAAKTVSVVTEPEPATAQPEPEVIDLLAGLPPLPEPPPAFGDLELPLPPAPPLLSSSPEPAPLALLAPTADAIAEMPIDVEAEIPTEVEELVDELAEVAQLPDPPKEDDIEALMRLHTIQVESAKSDAAGVGPGGEQDVHQPTPVAPELPPIPPPPPPPQVSADIEQTSTLPTPPPPPAPPMDVAPVISEAPTPTAPAIGDAEPGEQMIIWDSPVPTPVASDNPPSENAWETKTVSPLEPAADTPFPTTVEPQQTWPLAASAADLSPTTSWPMVQSAEAELQPTQDSPTSGQASSASPIGDLPEAASEPETPESGEPASAPVPFANAFGQATPKVATPSASGILDSWPEVAPSEEPVASVEDGFFIDTPEPTLAPKRTAFLKRLLAKKDDPANAKDLCPSCDSPARVDIDNPNLGQRHLSCPSCSKMWIESTFDEAKA